MSRIWFCYLVCDVLSKSLCKVTWSKFKFGDTSDGPQLPPALKLREGWRGWWQTERSDTFSSARGNTLRVRLVSLVSLLFQCVKIVWRGSPQTQCAGDPERRILLIICKGKISVSLFFFFMRKLSDHRH